MDENLKKKILDSYFDCSRLNFGILLDTIAIQLNTRYLCKKYCMRLDSLTYTHEKN